jgi:uncharacterized protein (DUF488 family)
MTASPLCTAGRGPNPVSDKATAPIYTIGHSTRTVAQLIELLRRQDIRTIVDIRRFPRSAHNPQFNAQTLASELTTSAIDYLHEPRLGGRRHDRPIDRENAGWRNTSFQAFAGYMATSEFQGGLQQILDLSRTGPLAIMCSEALPWRCHRSLVADALLASGKEVFDIIGGRVSTHRMTSFARVDGTRVTYPSEAALEDGPRGSSTGRADGSSHTPGRMRESP